MATPLWTACPHTNPTYFINSVAVDDSGSRVAAGTWFHVYSSDATAAPAAEARVSPPSAGADPSELGTFGTYVWDASGNQIFKQEFAGWQGVYWVALSGDGGTVASSGWYQQTPTVAGFVAAWDVGTQTSLLMYPTVARGNMVSLSADGTVLLAAADHGYLFMRSSGAAFGATPVTIALTDPTDEGMVAAVDASGQLGLIVSYHGEVILFTIVAGAIGVQQRWQVPNSAYVHAAALSSDGRNFFVGANDGNLYGFNVANFLASPASMWSTLLPGGARTIYGVACDETGTNIAAAGNVGDSGVIAFYGNKYREPALYWQTTTAHSPNGLSMDGSGNYLGAADGHSSAGDLSVWQPMLGNQLWTYPLSQMSWPIAISANARLVAGGCDDGSLYAFAGPGAS